MAFVYFQVHWEKNCVKITQILIKITTRWQKWDIY